MVVNNNCRVNIYNRNNNSDKEGDLNGYKNIINNINLVCIYIFNCKFIFPKNPFPHRNIFFFKVSKKYKEKQILKKIRKK